MIDIDPIMVFCTLNPILNATNEWDNWNIEMQTTTADKNHEYWANGKLALSDHLQASSHRSSTRPRLDFGYTSKFQQNIIIGCQDYQKMQKLKSHR